MALSPLELVEEDCESKGLKILVFSIEHAETLIDKYYKENEEDDWSIVTFKNFKTIINKEIIIRSPITCLTPNFKMCRKCFGEKILPTKYLGIVAAQGLSERITQLIMRSFHTSGSATLDIDERVKDFFKDHLCDIEYQGEQIIIVCDTDNIPNIFMNIDTFIEIKANKIIFNNFLQPIDNKDAIATMTEVKKLLRKQDHITETPAKFYTNMMTAVLQVGAPYSSFVEMLFANMFLTDKVNKEFWRYNQDKKIETKLGDKVLASYLSGLLGLLYQPNKKSLGNTQNLDEIDFTNLNIYEKIWLGIYT